MDKLKILSIACIAGLIVSIAQSCYIGYNHYKERKQLKKDNLELTNRIEKLQQIIEKNNKTIADNEQSKRKLENESIERQEQINEQLKNDDCANQHVPMSISGSMYNRAKSLRESPDTSKPAQ